VKEAKRQNKLLEIAFTKTKEQRKALETFLSKNYKGKFKLPKKYKANEFQKPLLSPQMIINEV